MKRTPSKNLDKKEEPDDLIKRFINFWNKEYGNGWDKIVNTYFEARDKCHTWTDEELKDYFYNVIWPKLLNHRICNDPQYDYTEDQLLYWYDDYYSQWYEWSNLKDCKIYNPKRLDIYPYRNYRTPWNTGSGSSGLPLHQILARIEEMINNDNVFVPWGKQIVASHICHTKQCLVCAIKETKHLNTHRNYCITFTLINGYLFWTCQHEPKCRDFGPSAFY